MRLAPLLLTVLVLAAPFAAADGGDTAHDTMVARQPHRVAVEQDNSTSLHVLGPGPLRAGDLVLVSVINHGPGTAQVSLVRSVSDNRNHNVATWEVPAGGGGEDGHDAQVLGAALPADGDHSILIETLHAEGAVVDLFIDHPAPRFLDGAPPEMKGALVYSWTATGSGRASVVVQEPAAHFLDVQVVAPRFAAASWPGGYEVLAQSPAEPDVYDDAVKVHRLHWDAAPGQTVFVVTQTHTIVPPGVRPVPEGVFYPWDLQVTFTQDAAEQSTPAPSGVVPLALLGAVWAARRFRRAR